MIICKKKKLMTTFTHSKNDNSIHIVTVLNSVISVSVFTY